MIQDFAPAVPSAPTNSPLTTQNGNTHQAWQSFFDDLGQYMASSTWQVGDYRQSALAAAVLGPQWLPCDGSRKNTVDYPALSAILTPLTGGSTDGTFSLPGIAASYSDQNSNVPYLQTFIKAM